MNCPYEDTEALAKMIVDPVEIVLDKPRRLLITKRGLRLAEAELNKQRYPITGRVSNIDAYVVQAINDVIRLGGIMPRDLIVCLLWAALLHEDSKLKIEQIDEIMDKSVTGDAEISGQLMGLYLNCAGPTVQKGAAEPEKKTTDPQTGPDSGASPVLN